MLLIIIYYFVNCSVNVIVGLQMIAFHRARANVNNMNPLMAAALRWLKLNLVHLKALFLAICSFYSMLIIQQTAVQINLYLFANDTNLFIQDKSPKMSLNIFTVNMKLNLFTQWVNANKLTRISKSNVVIILLFSTSRKTINIDSLISTLNPNRFSFVNEANNLVYQYIAI